jgi:hypothetical protein
MSPEKSDLREKNGSMFNNPTDRPTEECPHKQYRPAGQSTARGTMVRPQRKASLRKSKTTPKKPTKVGILQDLFAVLIVSLFFPYRVSFSNFLSFS